MTGAHDAEALAFLREHRALFERLAASELPISEDAQRALAFLDETETADG